MGTLWQLEALHRGDGAGYSSCEWGVWGQNPHFVLHCQGDAEQGVRGILLSMSVPGMG